MKAFVILATWVTFLAALVLGINSAEASSVFDIRIGKHPDKTRVVLDLNERTSYRSRLANGNRALIITLQNASWEAGYSNVQHSKGLIHGFQQLRGPDGALHVTLSGHRPMVVTRQFELGAKGASPHRIVFDLKPTTETLTGLTSHQNSVPSASQAAINQIRPRTGGWVEVPNTRRSDHAKTAYLENGVVVTENTQNIQNTIFDQNRPRLLWSINPKFEYLYFNPNRRDGSSSSVIQSETVPMLNFGGTLGYHTPKFDYLTTLLYGLGDAKFTGTSAGSGTGTGRYDAAMLDLSFLVRRPVQNTPLALSYGARWFNEYMKASFDDEARTFSATGNRELKRTVNYYLGELGFDASTPIGPTGRDRLFTEAKFGLGYWNSEVMERTNSNINPDQDDFLASMELKLGYEFAGSERWSGQAVYRASFLTLDDILEEFTIIHGPSLNFTYRF